MRDDDNRANAVNQRSLKFAEVMDVVDVDRLGVSGLSANLKLP